MALGKRKREEQGLWIATTELPKLPRHPFYKKLNELLAEAKFDAWIEDRCQPYCADKLGRPLIPRGVYFRMILVGYLEGIGSQHEGTGWPFTKNGKTMTLKKGKNTLDFEMPVK